MSDKQQNRNTDNDNRQKLGEQSIGNRQGTTQTGTQNGGGENIDQQEDQFTDDLRQAGDRNSSNRKNEGSRGR